MKILVTGGAGYIGTELVFRLAEDPNVSKVVVYDNLSRGNYNFFLGSKNLPADKIEFVDGDILDTRKFKKSLEGVQMVYHLAAKVTTPFADQEPHMFEQVNHWGTAEIAYNIEESDVERLVYLSSTSVYGASSEEVNAESGLNPKTFYGISKMRGEEHVRRLANKLKVYTIRCGNVYGYSKSMRFDAVINRFMFDAHYKGKITVNGNGDQFRSFIHIDRATGVLAKLASTNLEAGVYNLADRPFSINEIAQTLQEIYPDIESMFINQHLKLRELKVQPSADLMELYPQNDRELRELLKEFKSKFTLN